MAQIENLLPEVTEAHGLAVQTEVLKDKDYLENLLARIREENPQVAKWIDTFSQHAENPDELKYAGALIYRLLEVAGPLPIVSEAVVGPIQAEMLEVPGNDYVRDLILRTSKKNAGVANFLSNFAMQTSDPTLVAYAGIMSYRLLEKQAEADQLKKDFNL